MLKYKRENRLAKSLHYDDLFYVITLVTVSGWFSSRMAELGRLNQLFGQIFRVYSL